MIVCVFNVTDISEPTRIVGYTDSPDIDNTSEFSRIEIDGVILPQVVHEYQFESTGLHTVKYLLVNDGIYLDGTLNNIPAVSIKFPYTLKYVSLWSISSLILESIDLNSVEVLKGSCIAFTQLNSVYIPKTVTQYGEDAGGGYKTPLGGSVLSITVDPDNPIYDSRNNCNAVIETNTNTLL